MLTLTAAGVLFVLADLSAAYLTELRSTRKPRMLSREDGVSL